MSKSFNLKYFGDIRAVEAGGAQIGFVTEHEEGLPTALFLIDAESNKLSSVELPCGGLSLVRLGDAFWIGGTDGGLYSATAKDKAARKSKIKLPSSAKRLVAISETEFACLCDQQVVIVGSAKVAQTLELTLENETDSPTALHANPDGTWLAVGCLSGTVSVFQREEQKEFELSESAALHQGEVTSILFEPEELRFFSVGADQKLLLTHARGTLEPEDRGRANNHDQRVTSMLLAGENRFITGSLDKSCKSWARAGATKPSTLASGIVSVTGLAIAAVHKRTMLVVSQSDNSIRLFLIDAAGKLGQATDRYNDIYVRANDLFDSNSTSDRGVALHDLAALDDLKSVRLIANRIGADNDPKLRMTAVELLCKSKHAKHREQLRLCLGDRNEPVRRYVFDYLSKSEDDSNELLKLCKEAIVGGNRDIGCEAVKVLQKLSTSKSESDAFRNRARDVIVSAFESDAVEIRRSAILALEGVYEKDSARPNLIAMQSKQPDSRRIGLIRLMQRKLLADADAAAGIRKKIEDADPDVRKAAALMLVLSRKKLAAAIRERDADIDRQISALESFSIEEQSKKSKPAKEVSKPKKVAKAKKKAKLAKPMLADEDFQPLLIAVASRSMDTCLMGAKCLALLEDPRAFGLLMQLSREKEESARVDACNALAALGDPRAKERLAAMLADQSIAVRDAAYSALSEIGDDDPIAVASDGLAANQEDVRRRGLDTLIKHVRKTKPKSTDDPSVQLLLQSLNDAAASVRGEAFKFILNTKIGGSSDQCLRLCLSSSHADIRHEVFNETLGQKMESWAPTLLADLLDDPDESLRAEVFAALKKDKKDNDIDWLGDAVGRKYADIRELACKKLASNRTVASREHLQKAIDDEKPAIRQLVLRSLIFDGAAEQLVEALSSSKIDVKLGAAKALARSGNQRSKDVLVDLAQQEAPTVESLQIEGLKVGDLESFVEVWRFGVTGALDGLAMLGDPTTFDCALGKIEDDDESVREHASAALAWLAGEEVSDQIRPLLRHADDTVKTNAAFALAMAGDPVGLPLLFSADSNADQVQQLVSAVVLGEKAEGRLINLLDTANAASRNAGMIVLLCRDHLMHAGEPRRAIACLAAVDSRVRLCSASFVENFGDDKAFTELLTFIFNNRGDQELWTIPVDDLKKVAAIVAHGDRRLVAMLIRALMKLDSDKQKEWDHEWNQFAARYSAEIDGLVKKAKPPKSKVDQASLKQLAFGTWVGLARDQSRIRQPSFGYGSVAVRLKALTWLVEAAQEDDSFLESTVSVLTQTAGDPTQEIRSFAFAQLETLGVSDEDRAAIAIETGHLDLAVSGLTLLTSTGSKAKRQALLKNVVLNRNDRIAFEAATLLKKEMDEVEVCKICFDAPYVELPSIAVNWLAALFDSDAKAQKIVRSVAMDAEDERMRRRAIQTLVANKDESAFDALAKANEDDPEDGGYLKLFARIGDERSGGYLLDRIDQDQQLDAKPYLEEVGNTLDASLADRLIGYMETWPKRREQVYKALLKISGFNQNIFDPNDESPDTSWLERQHPRHDDVLAKLLEATNRFGKVAQLRPLIAGARWAKSDVVQAPLELLAIHTDEPVRHAAVEALGFRAKKRSATTEVLETACDHRDPVTKFLAAEGLAHAGNDSGIHILLTAIELVEDPGLRKRAVLALGHLADERAYEVLFNLASDTGHALQDSALEAIGHLRESPNRDKILQTLLQSVNAEGSIGRQALIGLRWLDAPEGWDRIRELAQKECVLRGTAIAQLGFDDSATTKDCVLSLAESYPGSVQILHVARRIFGEDSIAAELVWASNNSQASYDAALSNDVLHRILKHASADQIFELLGQCPDAYRQPLIQHLMKQEPLPVATAAKLLDSELPRVVEAGAWIIGRAADTKHKKPLVVALDRLVEDAVELNQEMVLANRYTDPKLDELLAGISRTTWALGVLGGSEKKLAELIADHSGSSNLAPIRHVAAEAIVQADKLTAATAKLLEPFVDDHDPLVRNRVAEALSKAPKTNLETLAGNLISDRVAFSKLASDNAKDLSKTLKSAASDAHYQSRALALLVDSGDAKTLGDVASDGDLDLFTRMGAVEGLAKMMNTKCEKTLESIGKDEKCDEELRKAAWRGLRRSKRRRLAQQKA